MFCNRIGKVIGIDLSINNAKNKLYDCIKKNFIRYQNNFKYDETIYALSTKFGKSSIAVIKVSGTQAKYVYEKLSQKSKLQIVERKCQITNFYSKDNIFLDRGLAVFFKGPQSFTGEDVLELHLHGGISIINAVLKLISELNDEYQGILIRYAENGEFSRRGFLNGKFDLTEIEGMNAMIDADTEIQRRCTLRSFQGEANKLFKKWKEITVENLALLTAIIDFGEEHSVEDDLKIFQNVYLKIEQLKNEIKKYLKSYKKSEILLRGIRVSLIGPPNAGKSSLLNYISERNAAIVNEHPGTTRDIIDVHLNINDYKVILSDTAGIRDVKNASEIEAEGIKMLLNLSLLSDLVVIVLPVEETISFDLKRIIEQVNLLKKNQKEIIFVLNKIDLFSIEYIKNVFLKKIQKLINVSEECFSFVSCHSGDGIENLIKSFVKKFNYFSSNCEDVISLSSRAHDILKNDVLYGFDQFIHWHEKNDILLKTEFLKQSVHGFEKITGENVGLEELLDIIFSKFCIGK